MSDIKLEVGDRVTYKYLNTLDKKEITSIVQHLNDIKYLDRMTKSKDEISSIEILKIERPKYEVIEEKKELLTEEEKEFLRLYMSFEGIVTDKIYKQDGFIKFVGYTGGLPLYTGFENLVEPKIYTLSELRIGGLEC